MNSAAGGARECSKKVLAFQNSLWLHMYVVAENQGYHCRAGLARRACGEDVRPVSGSFCEAGTHRVSTRETYCLVGIPFLQGGEEVNVWSFSLWGEASWRFEWLKVGQLWCT